MNLYDAHNHLQDERLSEIRADAVREAGKLGLARMVVNGSAPDDWAGVRSLADRFACVIPSYGVHPWYVEEVREGWVDRLREFLIERPSAVGEIGLDRWIEHDDMPKQEEVFLRQWRLARELDRPVTIHCLKAWGRLYDLLRTEEKTRVGFLLHSYGGPREMIAPLAQLGAFFSLSGYFAHPRKAAQAEVFRDIPPDRLLLETDAPDMWPPEAWNEFPLPQPGKDRPINHPANIRAVYRFAAELLGQPTEALARQVEENFFTLFGPADAPSSGKE